MYFGTDYYPEHVSESRWREDARLMRDAGMDIVRLAEFAWCVLEPQEGAFDFGWLDGAISVLASEGIKIVLGTPTAAPPKWLVDKYPAMLPVDRLGRARKFGMRRHYCSNNPDFRRRTVEIVRRLAERYGERPEIAAWQIDNELGGHDTVCCYCPECLRLFRAWLRNRYKAVEELNRQWGTVFWSQRYESFEEVEFPPAGAFDAAPEGGYGCNPGQVLDFQRFSSESVAGFQSLQAGTIRKYSSKPITSNFMGHFSELDYFELAKDLDFVSWDNYPRSQWGGDALSVGMAGDLMRGLKGKNFWVMEQQSGPCGWNALGDTPKPGQLRLFTWQAIAHGAEAVLYFPWRACPFGAEQYWYGVLGHDNVPGRRYFEIKDTIGELRRIAAHLEGASVAADIAIIKSYDNAWSHMNQPHSCGFNYGRLLQETYNAVRSAGYMTDVTGIGADLSRYRIVLLPAFNLTTPEIVAKLDAYVRQGGTLVLTFRCGTREWNNSMSRETIPGPFAVMAGIRVDDFDALGTERKTGIKMGREEGTASVWCDVIQCKMAVPVAVYTTDYYAGKPAVTRNSHGEGAVWYIGCWPDTATLKALVAEILADAGAAPILRGLSTGVEAVALEKGGKRNIVLMNHGGTPVTAHLDGEYTDLLTGKRAAVELRLEPYGVALLADS